jgi:hypothetical protein
VSGVIKGSCLGPALFLVFINDIDTAVDLTNSFLSKFADDTKMASIVESEEARQKFQEGVDSYKTGTRTGNFYSMLASVRSCTLDPTTRSSTTQWRGGDWRRWE